MFSLYLLVFSNGYLDIQETRAAFFTDITAGLGLLCLISVPIYLGILKYDRGYVLDGPLTGTVRRAVFGLSVTDYAMLAFAACCTVGTLFSRYPSASFTGGYGRFMGLEMYLLIALMYFLVSRGYRFQNSAVLLLLAISAVMAVIALLQFLKFDPFGLYQNIASSQQSRFVSTIGNVDFFSSFVTLVLPLAACSFCFCEKKSSQIIYAASTLLGFLSMLVSRSLSGLAAMCVLFFFLGMFAFRSLETLSRYVFVVFLALLSCKLLWLLAALRHGRAFPMDSFFRVLMVSKAGFVLLALTLAAFLLLQYFHLKGYTGQKGLKMGHAAFATCGLGAVAAAVFCFVWFTFIDRQKDIGAFSQLFRFNRNWGTGRGYIFGLAADSFTKFNPFQKLFGYGMDMFQMITRNLLHVTSHRQYHYDIVYDQTHNELLGYLLSTGLLGAGAYVTFVFSQIFKNLRNCAKEPLLLVLAVSVACYFTQSLTDIAEPMVVPLFFLLIAISESVHREMRSEKNHRQ